MPETIKKPAHQFYFFIAGILLFSIIAAFGWIKLQYGFAFVDEGYHMVEGWRLSAGDHFINDTPHGALRNYRLFTKKIFDLWPDITLLGFRKLQFFLTLFSLFIFGSALYRFNDLDHDSGHCRGGLNALPVWARINPAPTEPGFSKNGQNNDQRRFNKQYWYLPFIFSIFAFTGLDPLGATSNLNYYTYPHLFLVLHITCLLLGVRASNSIIKSILFLFSGACLWAISLCLLHQTPVMAGPIALYILAKFLDFKRIKFRFKDLSLVLAPPFFFWAVFLAIYDTDYIHSVLASLALLKNIPIYSSGLIQINWTVLAYSVIMFILAVFFLMVLNTFSPYKIIYLIFLSILTFFITHTSIFLVVHYYKTIFFKTGAQIPRRSNHYINAAIISAIYFCRDLFRLWRDSGSSQRHTHSNCHCSYHHES